jgi:hypothetical protein
MKPVLKIDTKHMTFGIPLQLTAIVYLLLDKFQAAGWVWGVVGTLLALIWLVGIISILTAKYVDITPLLEEQLKRGKG